MAFALRLLEVHFGKGEVRKLPEIVGRFGRRPFVVTGSRPAPVTFDDTRGGRCVASPRSQGPTRVPGCAANPAAT